MKCIIKYKDDKEHECFCGQLKECSKCSIENNREEEKCIVEIGGYCTCRLCGYAGREN